MTQAAIPSWRMQHLVRASMPYSAIVDINGVHNPKTGGFHSAEDAIDAGHKSVFIRKGTYPPFQVNQSGCVIQGEGPETVIDGADIRHAIEVSQGFTTIRDLKVRTTPGAGNGYDGVKDNSGGFNLYERLYCLESDSNGFEIDSSSSISTVRDCVLYSAIDGIKVYSNGSWTLVMGCYLANTGAQGIYFDSSADNSLAVANRCNSNTGAGIELQAAADNSVVVANRSTGSGITDGTSTSTVGNNDTT